MNPSRALLFIALLGLGASAQAKRERGQPGQFDYYAVALSWSPSYCATSTDADQCAIGRQLGFVLHGLWPQHENGYPESCSNEPLPAHVRGAYGSLFPSPKLIGHEWRRHGTCSGLDPAAYFSMSAKLKQQVAIPASYQRPTAPLRVGYGQLVQAFQAVNPGMAQNAVLPFCSAGGRFLREIHVCYDKRGRSRSCSAAQVKRSSNSCRQESFILQSVR